VRSSPIGGCYTTVVTVIILVLVFTACISAYRPSKAAGLIPLLLLLTFIQAVIDFNGFSDIVAKLSRSV
jgi:hypothetical protein